MQVFHKSTMSMGTRFHLVIPDFPDEEGEQLWLQVQAELGRIMNKLNRFDENSLLAQINSQAGIAPFSPDDEMTQLLSKCSDVCRKTEGFFMPLRPTASLEDSAMEAFVQEGAIVMDTLMRDFFLPKGFVLDMGAVGKGYAMDKVRELLLSHKVHKAFVSFGESSVLGLGAHPKGAYWPLGIQHPEQHDSLGTLRLVDQAVGISSSAEGNSHIINPETGKLVNEKRMVAVQGVSAMLCDMLATAIVAGFSEQKATALFSNYQVLTYRY